jgi:hypothetical protein
VTALRLQAAVAAVTLAVVSVLVLQAQAPPATAPRDLFVTTGKSLQ